jgi:hypothetical protein
LLPNKAIYSLIFNNGLCKFYIINFHSTLFPNINIMRTVRFSRYFY